MNIRQRKEMIGFAGERLSAAPAAGHIVLLYSALTLGLALTVTAVNYVLGRMIGQTGGLSNMGTRAILDTLRQMLPMAQTLITACLELGYCAAMLRIARGQYASLRTLKLGFDRFWPLLRLTLIRGAIFLGLGFLGTYLGIFLYLATPLSDPAIDLLEPMISAVDPADPAALLETTLMDPGVYAQLLDAMTPCFLLCVLFYVLLSVPAWYRYRMAAYLLIDRPGAGAMAALRESRRIMRRNRFLLFRLDLSLWYYHLSLLLAGVLAYGDTLLALLGVSLPFSEDLGLFLFYGLYLAVQFGLYYFLRNRVEVSYCLAYDSLLPKAPENTGVVLGNIFQM